MKGINKKGWIKVKLGEICRNVNETVKNPLTEGIERYIGLEHIEPGNLHIKSWGKVADGTTFTKKFNKGQVLFGKRRAYQKKAAIAGFNGICSGDILVFEANESVISKKLFPFLIASDHFFDYAVQTSAGSLSPRTKFQDLANLEFHLPPKEQQAELAELLWSADYSKERYKELYKTLEVTKRNYFDFSFNASKCKQVKLNQIAVCLDNRRVPIKSSTRKKGNIPYYGASGIVDYVNDHIYSEPILLISEDGENLNTRNLPIAYEVDEKCWVNNHAHVLHITKGSRYLVAEYFNNSDISDYVSGSTRPKLNKSTLMDMSLLLPDFEEHEIIEEKLKQIDLNLQSCKKQLMASQQLLLKILNQIFSSDGIPPTR